MNILHNLIPASKLLYSLTLLAEFKKDIDTAKARGDFEEERRGILKTTDTWGSYLVKAFDIRLMVNGKENLPEPESGPVVYVANHQGYADIPICCAVLNTIQFGFIAKNSLEKIPLYGTWMARIRSVFIQRDDARASLKAIEQGIELIERGFSLLIFPEGTRSKGAAMREFKKGSLRLATKPGVPIIPVTISGSYDIFERESRIQKGTRVNLTIHPAIPTAGLDKKQISDLTEQVENVIRSAMPVAAD